MGIRPVFQHSSPQLDNGNHPESTVRRNFEQKWVEEKARVTHTHECTNAGAFAGFVSIVVSRGRKDNPTSSYHCFHAGEEPHVRAHTQQTHVTMKTASYEHVQMPLCMPTCCFD